MKTQQLAALLLLIIGPALLATSAQALLANGNTLSQLPSGKVVRLVIPGRTEQTAVVDQNGEIEMREEEDDDDPGIFVWPAGYGGSATVLDQSGAALGSVSGRLGAFTASSASIATATTSSPMDSTSYEVSLSVGEWQDSSVEGFVKSGQNDAETDNFVTRASSDDSELFYAFEARANFDLHGSGTARNTTGVYLSAGIFEGDEIEGGFVANRDNIQVNSNGGREFSGIEFGIGGYWFACEGLRFNAELGAGRYETENSSRQILFIDSQQADVIATNDSNSDNSPYYAVGLDYIMGDHFVIGLDYTETTSKLGDPETKEVSRLTGKIGFRF